MFVVHRESPANKPNMEFWMHESGLHYYDPRNEEFTFINTVSGKKEGFTQRQIKGAEVARTLYITLSYPSWKDFKWVIRSNQIKDWLSGNGPRCQRCPQDLGEESRGIEREDH
jgi:hypothetical protein